jgi:hypothetical protein
MKLADFMLNTNTPSQVRLCFLKQISFHVKFTLQRRIKAAFTKFPLMPVTGAKSFFVT